ncbi:unnamed protein product [Rhodiola kirilowii]
MASNRSFSILLPAALSLSSLICVSSDEAALGHQTSVLIWDLGFRFEIQFLSLRFELNLNGV